MRAGRRQAVVHRQRDRRDDRHDQAQGASSPNTDKALWPGQFVDVVLTLDASGRRDRRAADARCRTARTASTCSSSSPTARSSCATSRSREARATRGRRDRAQAGRDRRHRRPAAPRAGHEGRGRRREGSAATQAAERCRRAPSALREHLRALHPPAGDDDAGHARHPDLRHRRATGAAGQRLCRTSTSRRSRCRRSLPGASPETMASSVATPLENQFSTIAGLDSMTSSSRAGHHARSRCSSLSTATSTAPRRTCRRRSPRRRGCCRRACRRRRRSAR